MKLARYAAISAVCLSMLAIGACSKEESPPLPQKSAAPAPAPAAPAPPPAETSAAPSAGTSAPRIDSKGALELAKTSGCTACHAIDNKIVGPAYKDVAAKYRGQSGAQAMLIEKVRKGGQGVWGQVPMPPQSPLVSDGDIRTLVEWVLSMR